MLSTEKSIPQPMSNRDYEFFYQGLRDHKLLVQKCGNCGAVRNPPGPMCPNCRSLEWAPLECSGRGSVYSYTIHYHPPLPGYDMPHAIALADMAEGFRLLGSFAGAKGSEPSVGMPIKIEFVQSGETATYQFRPE